MRVSLKTLHAHKFNESFQFFVYGPPTYGKSSYLIQSLAEVFGEKEVLRRDDGKEHLVCVKPNWDAWKEHMVFLPEQWMKSMEWQQDKGEPGIRLDWDDEALWATNQKWADEFSIDLSGVKNVSRTVFNTEGATGLSPNWILKRFREVPGALRIEVTKVTGSEAGMDQYRRSAKAYSRWFSPDGKKSGSRLEFIDNFYSYLPSRVYQEYNGTRRSYSAIALRNLRRTYDKLVSEGKLVSADRMRKEAERVGVSLGP